MKNLITGLFLIIILIGFVSAECTDSDGGNNIYSKGHLEDLEHGNAVYDDYCTNQNEEIVSQGSSVKEYYCGPNNYQYETIECENGCINGACMPRGTSIGECRDSDGINLYSKGRTQGQDSGDEITQEDYCKEGPGGKRLMEGYCTEDGKTMFLSIDCMNRCQEGVCLGNNDEIFECQDTDAKDKFSRGYIEGSQYSVDEEEFLSMKYFYDSCSEKEEGGVLEYFCDSGMIVSETFACENGCSNGACKKIEEKCFDNDNGINYLVKGEIYVNGEYHNEDKCNPQDKKVLNEWYCEEDVQNIESYECENGCVNGACIKSEGSCSGCWLMDMCYAIGHRKDGSYCSDKSREFIAQTKADNSCENNFECTSNLCIDNSCISSSLWQKILSWFKRFF
jgi:hypothetical protein